MTSFVSYVQLDAGESNHIDYRNAEKMLKDVHDRHKYSFKHPFLRPVRDIVTQVQVHTLCKCDMHLRFVGKRWKSLWTCLGHRSVWLIGTSCSR